MSKFRLCAMVVAVVVATAAVVRGQATSAGAVYRLGPGSDFQTGCFPPCLCPSLPTVGKPKGTFRLAFAGQNGAIRTYHVRDVNADGMLDVRDVLAFRLSLVGER